MLNAPDNSLPDSAAVAAPPPTTRSAVANGSTLWIDGVDGRSKEARRFRDVYGDLVEHLGGDDYATEPQKHIARRAAALIVWAEMAEAKLAAGGNLNVGEYTTSTNALRRLLADIGLARVMKDVTPDVRAYLAGKAAQRASTEPAGESRE